jgi:hypothetical protein
MGPKTGLDDEKIKISAGNRTPTVAITTANRTRLVVAI